MSLMAKAALPALLSNPTVLIQIRILPVLQSLKRYCVREIASTRTSALLQVPILLLPPRLVLLSNQSVQLARAFVPKSLLPSIVSVANIRISAWQQTPIQTSLPTLALSSIYQSVRYHRRVFNVPRRWLQSFVQATVSIPISASLQVLMLPSPTRLASSSNQILLSKQSVPCHRRVLPAPWKRHQSFVQANASMPISASLQVLMPPLSPRLALSSTTVQLARAFVRKSLHQSFVLVASIRINARHTDANPDFTADTCTVELDSYRAVSRAIGGYSLHPGRGTSHLSRRLRVCQSVCRYKC